MESEYYNSRLKVLSSERNLVLGLIQENSIEFQVQSVYLIYVRLLVYATLILAYSKNYAYYMLLICKITSLF